MSSFRPSAPFIAPNFEPSPTYAAAAAIAEAGQGEAGSSRFVPNHLFKRAEESAEETPDAWTPERLEELEQAAFQRGVESARESGSEVDRVLETLNSAASGLEQVASTSISANRDLLLGLAMEISRKWVGEEFKLDPAIFGDALDRAIDSLTESEGAKLVLNPEDHAVLIAFDPERMASWQAEHGLRLDEDESLARASFRLEGQGQLIDGAAEAVLDRLRIALDEAFEANLPEVAS